MSDRTQAIEQNSIVNKTRLIERINISAAFISLMSIAGQDIQEGGAF